ncbi:uncharacterized protein LOC119231125 isoform X2 [Talpa occidentalis]|uniref:uncharacterized protein LOC119231125 isoform X2 n=1 Tax=Talpa occidentalis TaxID=50954 RepID=UPI0023F6FA01|nr:uncharacterized protein LOC119231125 isoform X2 [Talpa occidentalis]
MKLSAAALSFLFFAAALGFELQNIHHEPKMATEDLHFSQRKCLIMILYIVLLTAASTSSNKKSDVRSWRITLKRPVGVPGLLSSSAPRRGRRSVQTGVAKEFWIA